MLKMIGKRLLVGAALLGLATTSYGSCRSFEREAEAYEGVVPRFDESGSLKSLSMYGEGNFLVAKRSLIADARRKAELGARRAYSEFLNSNFSASTLAASLIETSQNTDQDGNMVGSVTELESTLTVMQNDTASVMTGVVKLDECVDVEGKYLLVRMGWKPAFSRAAGEAAGVMADSADSTKSASSAKRTQIEPADGYRKKSSLADDF
jgi:hypothetical protein